MHAFKNLQLIDITAIMEVCHATSAKRCKNIEVVQLVIDEEADSLILVAENYEEDN